MIDTILQDVRYALRGLRRTPGFALTVIGTIALGLGLNTTVFTIFNAYVLRPLAVRDPYGLYQLMGTRHGDSYGAFNWQEFEALRGNPAFSEAAGQHYLFARVEGHPLQGELVTGNYFRMLGVNAARGRLLLPADAATPGRQPVIVLSYLAWQNKFGADPAIIGRKLPIHGYPLEVVGIAAPMFTGLGDTPRDFWAPLTMSRQLEDGPDVFSPERQPGIDIVGRLAPGTSVRQATAVLSGWVQRATAGRPPAARATGAALQSQATAVHLTLEAAAFLTPVLAAFFLILLIACANIANLMLARGMARAREIGIRLSLGAARGRLIRQLLTESIVLALPSAAAGFVLSQAAIEFGQRLMFASMPTDFAEFITVVPLQPDARVFAFMLVAALVSAVLFGLAPALQATRASVVQAAKGDFSTELRPARLRNALVIVQITASVLLLISAGVLLRGARSMDLVDVGFRTRGVVELEFQEKFRSQILARLAAEPVVQNMAAAASPPLDGALPSVPVLAAQRKAVSTWYNFVSPEYFDVLSVPIVRGRNFTGQEAAANAPVTIVSQSTARKFWPNQDALGQILQIVPEPGANRDARLQPYASARVIGIAGDIVSCCLVIGKDPACVYLPATPSLAKTTLLLRVHGDDRAARRALDAGLSTISPNAIDQIHPMEQFRAGGVYPFRAMAWICSLLGGLALSLTLSGVYGVLSYLVTQRRKEIGIRMALGATAGSVSRLVLRQSLRLAVTGLLLGALLAIGVSLWLASFVASINAFDLPAYSAGALLVLIAAAAAAWIPSSRAARIDPITTLHYD